MNKNIICRVHNEDDYSNFCCTCYKPICPDGIDDHNKKHIRLNQTYEIDTIRRVFKKTSDKLKEYDKHLQYQLSRLSAFDNISKDKLIADIRDDLNKIKEIISNQIDVTFEKFEDTLIRSIENTNLDLDFSSLIDEINDLIRENNSILNSLSSDETFNYLVKAIKKDYKNLYLKIEKKVDKEINSKIDLPLQIVLNKDKIENFHNTINEIIYLRDKSINLNTNKELTNNNENDKIRNKINETEGYFQSKFKF